MDFLANFLVFSGAAILATALAPVNYLRRHLPPGWCRRSWMFLSVLIMFFFCGYVLYGYLFCENILHWSEMVVPVVFFSGAVFVLVVCLLSVKTADSIRHVCNLEHENVTDPLMGIYNRRHMEYCLRHETAKARRYGLDLSVLLIDVDFFKKVNDTHGHAIGDKVLQVLARIIKESVRDFDLVFRYGGEELLVLLPFTNARGAMVLGKSLCQSVADRCLIEHGGKLGTTPIRVTISIGVSTLSPAPEDEWKMVACADSALYQAKNNGRNRAEYYDDLGLVLNQA
jgi:diguanylate cyclase (GGDEF)-like protein